MSYWIFADIGSDLPKSFADKYEQFVVLPQPYRLNGVEDFYKLGDEAGMDAFYQKLKGGAQSSTSQITAQTFQDAFLPHVLKGEEILYIGLSSGISGSFQSAVLARNTILEDHPDAKLTLVDSLGASLGFGLLVKYALDNRAGGMSLMDNEAWLLNNRQRVHHWFTVDDLQFLFRGGRVSRSSAVLGSVLQIKPIMNVNREGKLVPLEKVQGRKRSLKELAQKAITLSSPKEGQAVFISHGGCRKDAQMLADLVRQEWPQVEEFFLSPVGAVIGSHSGPGTVAIFFLGDER